MEKRTATCHCGKLSLECEGEPLFVTLCHCTHCQKRTGSSYNLGAWFKKTSVTISGKDKVFHRTGDSGMELTYHFCPECGSNIFWEASVAEDSVGVAGGCFADMSFPKPSVSLYEKSKHQWLDVPNDLPCYLEAIDNQKK